MRALFAATIALLVLAICWIVITETTTMRRVDRPAVDRIAKGWQ